VNVPDPSTRYLLERLTLVEARVRAAVEQIRRTDPSVEDPFRGLYVSNDDVERILSSGIPTLYGGAFSGDEHKLVERETDALEDAGFTIRLRHLGRAFGLALFDEELLLVAVAPDLDRRFEKLYGYLNDDVTMRRATVGLALSLCGALPTSSVARRRLGPGAPLIGADLVSVVETDRPFLTRSLVVPDRVSSYLLGGDDLDPRVEQNRVQPSRHETAASARVASAHAAGTRVVYIRADDLRFGMAVASTAMASMGKSAVAIDVSSPRLACPLSELAGASVREASLLDAGLIVGPVESLVEPHDGLRDWIREGISTFIVGCTAWNPTWVDISPLVIEVSRLCPHERARVWIDSIGGHGPDIDEVVHSTSAYHLGPDQIARSVHIARTIAESENRSVTVDDLLAGARRQNSTELERLARRIRPLVGWDDLVVADDLRELLQDIVARVRHRAKVLEEWGLGRGSRRRGVTAMFAGPSGTGKTLAAEVLAAELGLDLYSIDLATVVDKYVGETEKNLERIFSQAEGVNGILFFDEADAIFGKRSAVSDARDRYANIEIAYLLQRMEYFDGLAILATNFRANVDDAFTRRIDVLADFAPPDQRQRLALWKLHLADQVPKADDIDLEALAVSLDVTGGEIRNIAAGAAFAACAGDSHVSMDTLIASSLREFRKIGRLAADNQAAAVTTES
jgi:hypothetical protein